MSDDIVATSPTHAAMTRTPGLSTSQCALPKSLPTLFCNSIFYSPLLCLPPTLSTFHHILATLLSPYHQPSVKAPCPICVQVMSPQHMITNDQYIARLRAGTRCDPPAPRFGDGLGRHQISDNDPSVPSQSTLPPHPPSVFIALDIAHYLAWHATDPLTKNIATIRSS